MLAALCNDLAIDKLMSGNEDDLFQPSLSAESPPRALYSPTACWVTAFFGGPIAALIIFGVNFHRAGLAAREAGWLVMASAIAIATLIQMAYARAGAAETGADADDRLLVRGAALAIAGLLYWRLRSAFRAQEMFAVKPPEPWVMGLAAVALNIVVSMAAVVSLAGMFR